MMDSISDHSHTTQPKVVHHSLSSSAATPGHQPAASAAVVARAASSNVTAAAMPTGRRDSPRHTDRGGGGSGGGAAAAVATSSPPLAGKQPAYPPVRKRSSRLSRTTNSHFPRGQDNNKYRSSSPAAAGGGGGGGGPNLTTFAKMQQQQLPFSTMDDLQQLRGKRSSTANYNNGSSSTGHSPGMGKGSTPYANNCNYYYSSPEELNTLGQKQLFAQQRQQPPSPQGAVITGRCDGGKHSSQLRNRHHHHQHHQPRGSHKNSDGANSRSSEGEEEFLVARDSFGNIAYERVFPGDPFDNSNNNHLSVNPVTDVPWELRDSTNEDSTCRYFAFLGARYFWFLIEWAVRVTTIGMLIPAVLINLNLPHTPFVSTTFAPASVVIAAGINFGQSSFFLVQYVKAGCLWLPIATACSALRLNRYLGAWFVVYTAVLFLLAMFTEKIARRMCLLLYNIAMVSLLIGNEDPVYPTRILSDWFLGAAFALVATLLPYPMLATRTSARISKDIFSATATCFTGILVCFWAPSNTQRSMSMVRIRHLVRSIDQLIDKFDTYDTFTFYEVLFFERYERREVRKKKVELLLQLKMNLRAMERVINMVQEKPQILDQSERCLLFRMHLSQPMEAISRSMEALLSSLSGARMYADLRELGPYFEDSGRAIKALQDEFAVARRILFYEDEEGLTGAPIPTESRAGKLSRHASRQSDIENNPRGEEEQQQQQQQQQEESGDSGAALAPPDDARLEEFVPLMTFFVFSIVNFWSTLREFQTFIDLHKPIRDWQQSFRLVFNALLEPFVENAMLVKHLFTRRAEAEVRVVIEAAKVSVAMLIAVIFFYYVDNQSLLLSGPTIIAFVSGTNPVEAVQASAARLSGTLFGACVGFFAASLCHTAVDRIAALCAITFVMTFFRTDKKIGVICMYCNFVAVSSLGPPSTDAVTTISRIQQNTFAIFIYCFISIAFFPVSPNQVLFEKRLTVVRNVSDTVKKLMGLMNEASACYVGAEEMDQQNKDLSNNSDKDSSRYGNSAANTSRVGFTLGPKGAAFDTLPSPTNLQRSRVFVPATLRSDGSAVPILSDHPEHVGAKEIVSINMLDSFVNRSRADLGKNISATTSTNKDTSTVPKTFVAAPEDTTVQNIFTGIFKTLDIMKATTSIMPLAADEFNIIPKEYPLRATGDVHAALYRTCALVYTMTCSWKAMREKGYFTRDVIHMFHNLTPIAIDITLCLERFSNILTFYIHHPSSGLSSELTKAVMQLQVLCVEFSARKDRDLLVVVRKTRAEKGIHRLHRHNRHRNSGARRGSRRRGHRAANDDETNSSSSGSSSSACSSSCASHRSGGEVTRRGPGGGPDDDNPNLRDGNSNNDNEPEEDVAIDSSSRNGRGGSTAAGNRTDGSNNSDNDMLLHSPPRRSRSERVINETRIFGLEGEDMDTLRQARGPTPTDDFLARPPTIPQNLAIATPTPDSIPPVASPTAPQAPGLPADAQGAVSAPPSVGYDDHHHHSSRSPGRGGTKALGRRRHSSSSLHDLSVMSPADRRAQLLREEVRRSHQQQRLRRVSSSGSGGGGMLPKYHSSSSVRRGGSYGSLLLGSGRLSREDVAVEEHLSRHRRPRSDKRGHHHHHHYRNSGSDERADALRKRRQKGRRSHHRTREELEQEDEDRARHADDMLSLPYGSREADLSLMSHEMTEMKLLDKHHSGGLGVDDVTLRLRQGSKQPARAQRRRDSGGSGDDRYTLPRSDSDSGSSSSDSASASPRSDDSDGSSSSSGSMIHFNESFTTPVTVLDAEGLHAFTLSLEMLTRELRKVLFGLEEMLQSQ